MKRELFIKAGVVCTLTFTLSLVTDDVAHFALTVIRARGVDTLSCMAHVRLAALI